MNRENSETVLQQAPCCKPATCYLDLAYTIPQQPALALYYDVRNRWQTMTKENLMKAKSIRDFLRDDDNIRREAFRNITFSVLHNDQDVRDIKVSAKGQTEALNSEQLALLASCDYSTNLRITGRDIRTDTQTGAVRSDDSIIVYMTVVPEVEAEFEGGQEALVDYLIVNTLHETARVKQDKLQPCKVSFTITSKATIANVKLTESSGYPSVDKGLMRVISSMPGNKWTPATNAKGEKVDQEFVFFFGLEGC